MRRPRLVISVALALAWSGPAFGAETVPTDIQQPGSQPLEVGNLESPNKCDNCHGGYDSTIEPAHNWRGSMMANAGRDPIFWATLAIAEQDFDGAGDLCIRCHSTAGWLAGRSTPTDGSALTAGDADGVECDFCHKMTNPDDSEWQGEQFAPFLANDLGDPDSDPNDVIGYYGSGMSSVWGGNEKLGPYHDAEARHQFIQSQFHRSVDFCGTCHDVSNPAVGNLAHNFGAQLTEDVVADGTLGGPVDGKAAFNNFPYQYGVVERTFSEYKAGTLSQTLVSDYPTLPVDLQAGALEAAYQRALLAGQGGDYADGTPRYFSCQTCHLRPVIGAGCNKNGAPVRTDLPLHDMTGGNYWMPVAIQYLDSLGKLRLGGGLTSGQIAALDDGIQRAHTQLAEAASLEVSGDTVKIVNLTGHKLISGYPEGRRMWLNVKWYDAQDVLLREDGAYGTIGVSVPNPAGGPDVEVESLLDLHDPNTTVFEAHMGMTREWAQQLVGFGYPIDMPLGYDRTTGEVSLTLGQLATGETAEHETFHFVLNNTVIQDNRIPPYGMSYDLARLRNALPVPASQYGDPGPGGAYQYWAEIDLTPPPGAVEATIELLYQPTSWEYIQFLWLANDGQNAFLANEGINMLDAWLNAGGPEVRMAKPHVIASTEWPEVAPCTLHADCDDGAFCNGTEVCSDGFCEAGVPPDCADGVACTDDACNEATDSCDHTPNDAHCDDGAFCNGVETCDPANDCQPGTPPDCADGVSCTDDACNEATDSCDHAPNDAHCDDGAFCNGVETCDAVLDCQAGMVPCPGQACDEAGDVCITCLDHMVLSETILESGEYVARISITAGPSLAINGPVAFIAGTWIEFVDQVEIGDGFSAEIRGNPCP